MRERERAKRRTLDILFIEVIHTLTHTVNERENKREIERCKKRKNLGYLGGNGWT